MKDVDKDEVAADLVHSFIFPQVKREGVQRQMVDLHGCYYTAATQVTDSVLNAKGFVHEVLQLLKPELNKRLLAGAQVVDASHCAVTTMIHAAVEQVLKKEGAGQEEKPKEEMPPVDVPLPQEYAFDVKGKHKSRTESRKSVSEHVVSMGEKIRSAAVSKSEARIPSSAKPSGKSSEVYAMEETPPTTPKTSVKASDDKSVKDKERPGTATSVTKEEAAVSEDEDTETELDEGPGEDVSLPTSPKRGPPSAVTTMEFVEDEDPELALWKIPIEVPPMLCDLIGLKEMELHSGHLELTETAVKVYDASCETVEGIFDDVKKCFTVSDEEPDEELDDDDPDQD